MATARSCGQRPLRIRSWWSSPSTGTHCQHDFRVDYFIEATASGQAAEKRRRLDELTSSSAATARSSANSRGSAGRWVGSSPSSTPSPRRASPSWRRRKTSASREGTELSTRIDRLHDEMGQNYHRLDERMRTVEQRFGLDRSTARHARESDHPLRGTGGVRRTSRYRTLTHQITSPPRTRGYARLQHEFAAGSWRRSTVAGMDPSGSPGRR